MFGDFNKNRAFLEHEFENAEWDKSTGMDPKDIERELGKMYDTSNDAIPVLRAKMYAFILDHAQIAMNPKTPFSAKINIGVNYKDTATQDFIQTDIYKQQLDKVRKRILTDEEYFKQSHIQDCGYGFACTDFWHTIPDWNNILRYGIVGLYEKAEKVKTEICARDNTTEKQLQFIESVLISYAAMLRMMKRIYEESKKYDIQEFSECILSLTERPPETLYEVMQTAVLFLYFYEIGPERARSLGPIDRLYLPYLERDLESGVSMEEEKDLFRYFFIHFTASRRFAQQPFMLGGSDSTGKTYCNYLTEMILDIYDELNIYDPKIHIRYHDGISDRVMDKVLDMIRHGNSSICILNDHVIYEAYDKMGIPREDSQDYVPLGCYEPIIMGMEDAEIGASWLSTVKPIEFVFNNGIDIISGLKLGMDSKDTIETFDEFMEEYYKQLDGCIDFVVSMINKEGEYATEINPSPLYSSTFEKCLENARDIHDHSANSAKYNNISIKLVGLATAVDSIYAVKKYVFDTKQISYSEMKDAILNNWVGYEEMRNKISNDTQKYGNNLEEPDDILKMLAKHIVDKYAYKPVPRGGVLRLGTDSITYCISYGEATAATPNGRKKGETLSKNLCPEVGKDKNGILSYMQTVLKIDLVSFVDSAVLDFMLHPSAVSGEKGLQDFKKLIRTFFAHGGYAVQGNILSAEELKKAQSEPKKYSNIQIRVCGWNEYFVNMSKETQNLFIAKYAND